MSLDGMIDATARAIVRAAKKRGIAPGEPFYVSAQDLHILFGGPDRSFVARACSVFLESLNATRAMTRAGLVASPIAQVWLGGRWQRVLTVRLKVDVALGQDKEGER